MLWQIDVLHALQHYVCRVDKTKLRTKLFSICVLSAPVSLMLGILSLVTLVRFNHMLRGRTCTVERTTCLSYGIMGKAKINRHVSLKSLKILCLFHGKTPCPNDSANYFHDQYINDASRKPSVLFGGVLK